MKRCLYVPKGVIDETLAQSSIDGKRQLEPLKTLAKEKGLPVNILEDKNVSNDAEVHRHEDDLWICLSGEVTFTVEGKMEDPAIHVKKDGTKDDREIKAKKILNGIQHTLRQGDILYIPAGQPHTHETKSEARLYIIKLPAKEMVPLEEVPGWIN